MRRTAMLVLTLTAFSACGRTGLEAPASSAGATTGSGAGAGGGSCPHPNAREVIATVLPSPTTGHTTIHEIGGAAVGGDTLYFTDWWVLYKVSTCGGGTPVFLTSNPDGHPNPYDPDDHGIGNIDVLAANDDGAYWRLEDGPVHWTKSNGKDQILHDIGNVSLVTTPTELYAFGPIGTLLRVHEDTTFDQIAAVGAISHASLPAIGADQYRFSVSTDPSGPPSGPIFSVGPEGGGTLAQQATGPWLSEMVLLDGSTFAIRPGDTTSAIVAVDAAGSQSVIVDGVSSPLMGLSAVNHRLAFASRGQLGVLDPTTGAIDWKEPSIGDPDVQYPDINPMPFQNPLAHDDSAVYVFEGVQIVRIAIP
jgi:hypothetical protein